MFFSGGIFSGKAAEAVENADDLVGGAQRRLERRLPDAAGGEGVVGDDRRLRRHHQRQIGVEDRLAVERAEIAAGIAAQAEAILAADIERNFAFELAPGGGKKADHAAEMVVMAVAEHDRVILRGIDVEDVHIVEQDFRRVAEIDHDAAGLRPGLRFRLHGKAPFAVEDRARRLVRLGIAALALNGEAVALFVRQKLNDDIIGDHAHGEPVHHRHGFAKRLGRRRAGIGGERRHHRRDEAGAAGAERIRGRQKCGGRILGAGTKQHVNSPSTNDAISGFPTKTS